MKGPTTIIIFIALIGLVLGGILLSSPPKSSAPATDQESGQPAVGEDANLIYNASTPRVGPENAKVKVVVFSDFLCPYCKSLNTTIDQLLTTYKDQVAVYSRNFIVHPDADVMARAYEAAAKQGKAKEAGDAIFNNFQTANEDAMTSMAQSIGLDINKFKADLGSDEIKAIVAKDNSDATALNLQGTPGVFVNGKYLSNPGDLETTIQGQLK